MEAYSLSEKELGPMDGKIMFMHFSMEKLCRAGSLDLF